MYGGLAILTLRAFRESSAAPLNRNPFVASMLAVLAVGSLDEFNQSFNSSRTGAVSDVILDLVGGLLALVLARIYMATGR